MQLNQQAPEPQTRGDGHVIDLHSIFHTIQGEGPFAGRPAVFVRLAGCNLRCPGCDTEYTHGRRLVDVQLIRNEVDKLTDGTATRFVVITGGEPFRQQLGPLVAELSARYFIQIESNGVLPFQEALRAFVMEDVLAIIISPKTSNIHASWHWWARAFKYVLSASDVNPDDGLPNRALMHKASPHIARPNAGRDVHSIFVNPMDEQDPVLNAANLTAVKDSCLKHGYTLGVQIHKLIGVE